MSTERYWTLHRGDSVSGCYFVRWVKEILLTSRLLTYIRLERFLTTIVVRGSYESVGILRLTHALLDNPKAMEIFS